MNSLQNAYSRDWTGTDPESNSKMPDPDDPESNSKMPDPDDPESNSKMPDPDDPSGYRFPSFRRFHPGGCGAVVVAPSCCCEGKEAAGDKAEPSPWIRPRDYSGFVIVRMARGVEHPCARSLWKLAKELGLSGLRAVLKLPGSSGEPGSRRERRNGKRVHLISRPLLDFHPDRVLELEQIRSLEKKAAKSPFRPRYSLTLYWRLDLRKHPGLVEEVVERLNGLAEVDLAYRELSAVDSMAANGQYLAEDQGYLEDAPLGIGASGVHLPSSSGGTNAQKLVLCDLEQGWNTGHSDLPSSVLPINDNRAKQDASAGHHGTAVLGQLVAMGNGPLGVRGAAGGLVTPILSSHWTSTGTFAGTNGHVAQAIVQALLASTPLAAGDILLLEVQRGLLPTEVDEADFDAIRLAAGLGVIVIEAAGNGGFDLDLYSDPDIRRSLRRGASDFQDSGAVLVGAARASLPHDRALFSNYGSRVDCFGWGETVTTCGYGDLPDTGNDLYTNRFSGTSSASPIIAGAAALLQALHEDKTRARLGPQAMRSLLADPATGTHQGPNVRGHIGVMPDLNAIVRDRLQLVPDVYLRRSVCDEGSAAGPHDEISSSPDILIATGGSGQVAADFGEGSRRENLPAPGVSYATGPQDVYVRLRNRGLGDGEVHVELFASPAATLITPELWTPIGSLDVSQNSGNPKAVPQGDSLLVAGPVVPAPTLSTGSLWSFLAVVSPAGEKAGLPPGPPYFDWAEYLTFLRQPGVAWRNTHRLPSPNVPSFCITGAPDRARLFDFEVIQRLPAGAKVTLQVPGALDAKLRQRQPWLQGGIPGKIDLPQRPRTRIRGVQLAAGACAQATFTISGNSIVTAGHSLALRQLWRGEEVGRITWYFGPHA